MITVAEYNHLGQLKPFESLWNRLLDRTPEACFSHSWDCLSAGHFAADTKLRILVALISTRPFGLLPLKVETRSTPLGTLRILSGALEPWCSFAGPVGPNTTAMLAASLRHLHRTRRDWDAVEFRLANSSVMLHNRLRNAFRLVGWNYDAGPAEDWIEICPESVIPPEFNAKFPAEIFRPNPRMVFERLRPDDNAWAPWPMLASCLSLVEDVLGSVSANHLRGLHQAAFRAGISDWCLLREEGVPQAAALNLFTRGGMQSTVLVGRSETLRLQLLKRLLEDALWRGDGPYLFRSAEIPFSERWTNATRLGFRYTHVSPWAFRARWTQFRERIQSRWTISSEFPETNSCPSPHKLSLYLPSSSETVNPIRPHALP